MESAARAAFSTSYGKTLTKTNTAVGLPLVNIAYAQRYVVTTTISTTTATKWLTIKPSAENRLFPKSKNLFRNAKNAYKMTKDTEITEVLFRKDKRKHGEITAVFPYDSWQYRRHILCYAHMGQHSYCVWPWVVLNTRPAKPREYRELKKELENLMGYNLHVLKNAKQVNQRKMYQL